MQLSSKWNFNCHLICLLFKTPTVVSNSSCCCLVPQHCVGIWNMFTYQIEAFSGRLKTIKSVSRIYPYIKMPPHFHHLICLAFVFKSNRVLHKKMCWILQMRIEIVLNSTMNTIKSEKEIENRTHTHQMYIIYIVCIYVAREREWGRIKEKFRVNGIRSHVYLYIVHRHRATANNSDAKVCIKYATTNRDGRLHFVYSMNWNGKKSC